jgi:hypothetical protein
LTVSRMARARPPALRSVPRNPPTTRPVGVAHRGSYPGRPASAVEHGGRRESPARAGAVGAGRNEGPRGHGGTPGCPASSGVREGSREMGRRAGPLRTRASGWPGRGAEVPNDPHGGLVPGGAAGRPRKPLPPRRRPGWRELRPPEHACPRRAPGPLPFAQSREEIRAHVNLYRENVIAALAAAGRLVAATGDPVPGLTPAPMTPDWW